MENLHYAMIGFLALTLAACGGEGETLASSASDTPQGETKTAKTDAPADPVELGKKLFGQCAICHSAKPDAASRVGPNLYGVYERPVGALDDFAYSRALKEADFVWTEETLDQFIENPRELLPGNRMAFAGMSDAEKRANLIAYLKSLRDAPAD